MHHESTPAKRAHVAERHRRAGGVPGDLFDDFIGASAELLASVAGPIGEGYCNRDAERLAGLALLSPSTSNLLRSVLPVGRHDLSNLCSKRRCGLLSFLNSPA